MEYSSCAEVAPRRFSEMVKEKKPSAETVNLMRGILKTLVMNIRYKLGWVPRNQKKKLIAELAQEDADAIDETIAVLINRYRDQSMPSRVTEKAANRVLKMVRNWVRRRYVKLSREELVTDEDLENFAPAVFDESAEEKLEDFERLHELGVIDLVEVYFLFAAYYQQPTSQAAKLIGMPEKTARKLLLRARERVQTFLVKMDIGGPVLPQLRSFSPESGLDVQRNIDMDTLMSAFRHMLGASRLNR